MVTDLLKLNGTTWEDLKINSLFNHNDTLRILSIPILNRRVDDKLILHHDKDDTYNLKSGYKMAMEVVCPDFRVVLRGEWSKMWNMKIP